MLRKGEAEAAELVLALVDALLLVVLGDAQHLAVQPRARGKFSLRQFGVVQHNALGQNLGFRF